MTPPYSFRLKSGIDKFKSSGIQQQIITIHQTIVLMYHQKSKSIIIIKMKHYYTRCIHLGDKEQRTHAYNPQLKWTVTLAAKNNWVEEHPSRFQIKPPAKIFMTNKV